ncbi:hypothetical protein [Actinomadura montaniterrae]|uniref:hypothetical protein n=1 Tax=Actinomadura montaniterrae TaxID=1803903 RepID=UPI00124E7EA1|nr:hypothetical protein [Actinomadura montaniterrae]
MAPPVADARSTVPEAVAPDADTRTVAVIASPGRTVADDTVAATASTGFAGLPGSSGVCVGVCDGVGVGVALCDGVGVAESVGVGEPVSGGGVVGSSVGDTVGDGVELPDGEGDPPDGDVDGVGSAITGDAPDTASTAATPSPANTAPPADRERTRPHLHPPVSVPIDEAIESAAE